MALKFLSSHTPGGSTGTSSSVKYFDIRLDNDYIVFRGNEDEAASAHLSGTVVLCLTEPLQISTIDLTLSGIVHMSWQTTSTSSISGRRAASKEKTFFEKSWTFRDPGKNKSEILQPDNYEWPFDCILEGGLPESIEGMKDAWIIYRLKANISRKRGKDIAARKPLRLVRTLDSSALELAHAMSVENVWPNKVEYSISIPSKAVAFGSFIRVDFKLIPLLKGLGIGSVSTQLKEEQEFLVDPEWGISALSGGQTKADRVIVYDNYNIDPEKDEQIIEEMAEGFQFSRYLELPKTLNKCLQDCNAKGIKVRHKMKFNIQLHNPDGHISELRANLPVSLYISPSLPINSNNDLIDQTPQASLAALENDLAQCAPPLYGEHTLDQIYSDVNRAGYITPGRALSQPSTPYLHSRNASSENLASLNALTSSSYVNSQSGSYVSPLALQHRLQNLGVNGVSNLSPEDVESRLRSVSTDGSRRNSNYNIGNDYFSSHDPSNSQNTGISPNDQTSSSETPSGTATQPESAEISRRTSEEDDAYISSGVQTPFAQFDHMEDLAKVPSYTTAVKTPLPRRGPFSHSSDLPSYGDAVVENTIGVPAEPPHAYIRNGSRGNSLGTSPSDLNRRTPPLNRNLSILQDEERRLRIMQQRALRG